MEFPASYLIVHRSRAHCRLVNYEAEFAEGGLLNLLNPDESCCATSEVDYWRNLALKMNWEFENLKDDASELVDILTLLQCQHQKC
ncbi:unnamed protein product [Trichobilharzia regenti]|nr:unnamed protein product [Trichobilharzia regenti]